MTTRPATVRDSGAGCLLGLAAGDQGSGAAYGHHTQLAMIVAYELLRHGEISQVRIRQALTRLAGGRSGRSRVRGAPLWLPAYLEREKHEGLGAGPHGGIDVATRAIPIGVWHRNNAAELVRNSIGAASSTHSDRQSAVAAAIMAGAIAGISHGQHGRDMVSGALEVGMMAAARIEADDSFEGDPTPLLNRLGSLLALVGAAPAMVISEANAERESLSAVLAAVVIGAPLTPEPFAALAVAASEHRRDIDAVVSAMVGTRVGLISWPSSIANDTWFAEVGRRLAAGITAVDDLPDLFEVEDRLSHGPPGGFR